MKKVYDSYVNYFKKVILKDESKDNFELLKKLKKYYKLALVTTCKSEYINILLETYSIEDLFDYIVAREDAKNLKPAPDAYLKTLEYLNLSPTEAIAMEDSKRGVEAAKSCNIKTVKVDNVTVIKYNIDGIIEEEFANKYLKKLLMNNESHF